MTESQVRELLSKVKYPGFPRDVVALGLVAGIHLESERPDAAVTVTLTLPAGARSGEAVRQAVSDELAAAGLRAVVHVHAAAAGSPPAGPGAGSATAVAQTERARIPGVRRVVAVSSGKGGVGKSTVATNLACAFAAAGLRTGLLDADVHGPSLPVMMGISDRPGSAGGKKIRPIERHGVACMSMGFFLDDTSPVIWRGPMVSGLVRQFLTDVVWGELDVLVVDLPPGTGDAQLTLAQQVEVDGAVIVTTPQDVALRDVVRGALMLGQVQVPLLGVVENMSFFQCPGCGNRDDVFGTGGGSELASALRKPLLARIPLDARVCAQGDAGVPVVVAAADSPVAIAFRDLARTLAADLDLLGTPARAAAEVS